MATCATCVQASSSSFLLGEQRLVLPARSYVNRARAARPVSVRASWVDEAGRRVRQWAREQRLQERLQDVQQNVERTAVRVDEEYELRKKAAAAAAAVEREAKSFESKTGVGRKLRLFFADWRRTWPGVSCP